jgi:NAD(P)-dependent dehydrogenase (short-subunit alcohol dehydrogenase family)
MKASDLFDLSGRVAIVTGGAAGLGRAYVEAMLDNGARVVILDRDPAALDAALLDLAGRGAGCEGETLNVNDRPAVKSVIDSVAARHGRLDILFANVGIAAGPGFLDGAGQRSADGAMEAIPDDLWDRVLATNLTSVFSTIRAAAPHMKAQGKGRIIVTASIAGLRPGPIVGTPYGVTKAAILHLVKQAALEWVRYGVLVNAIVPGPFLTQLTTPALAEAFARNSPMHRVATTDELHGLALFLASDASSYVTGTHMVIDGGQMLGRAD